MDTSIKAIEPEPELKPLAWKCTADGEYFAQFPDKRCKYCLPIYDPAELREQA